MQIKIVLCSIILMFSLIVPLNAQVDSTFISYYYPTSQTSPYWSYIGNDPNTKAANVFEMYNGNLVLQALGFFHTPEPELIFYQSPMIIYNRQGAYQSSVFGPFIGQETITNGNYVKVIKDGNGGYLALDSSQSLIARLNANLEFIDYINLEITPGNHIGIKDILPASDGFVIMGVVLSTNRERYAMFAKFDFNFNVIWHHSFLSFSLEYYRMINTSDGGYLFGWSQNPYYHYLKVSTLGDSLWSIESQTAAFDQLIESNNKYYGLNYSEDTIDTGKILVYAFGENFSIPNPDTTVTSIVTDQLFWEDDFSALRISNSDIVVLVSSPNGELFKYDSDFNLIWSSDNLINDRIGCGKTPVIELDNGDLIYCSRIIIQSGYIDKFALVRVNSNGQVTGVEDEYQNTPHINRISAYPNPFSKVLNIEINKDTIKEYKIEIYNIKGQLVQSIEVTSKTTLWKPKKMVSGIYIINLIYKDSIIESHKITFLNKEIK